MFLGYVRNVTAVLCLQRMVHVISLHMINVLYFYMSTFF
jgi:hypothetical protein